MKEKIYQIIFEHDTKAGKLFDVSLLWIILFSVFVVIAESIPYFHQNYFLSFSIIEWMLTILFSIEYLLRIYSSPKPLQYIFSFWGIIDLLSIFPTYLEFFASGYHYLISVRVFRLLRIFRILRLAHLNKEAQLLVVALKESRYKITVFFLSVLAIVVFMGTLMYVLEGEKSGFNSIPQGIYWAIVTITTVGFGDIVPQTIFGKILASFAMILGYVIIAIPTGIITVEISRSKKIRKKCPICEKENPTTSNYCNNCGDKFKD
ncbi:MAG: ion transporter [Flavobacteriales bacterium CG_4_9_14_3_um_filter_32_8]|nr:MAG: ion transporter [Flavobacteriales bacterium CG_4_9_14_3_um_filter_32_8]